MCSTPESQGGERKGVVPQENSGFGCQQEVAWMLGGQTHLSSAPRTYFVKASGSFFNFPVHILFLSVILEE